LKTELLREIVLLHRNRLLSRLRSKHALKPIRNKGKLQLDKILTEALQLSSQVPHIPVALIAGLRTEAETFHKLFLDLEAEGADVNRSRFLLGDVIESAYKFTSHLSLGALLSRLPNCQQLDPSSRQSLLVGMQKIGRYRSTCNFLIRAARRFEMFKRVEVKPIRPPEPAIYPMNMGSVPSLSKAMRRVHRTNVQQFYQKLARRGGISAEAAQDEFEESYRIALKKSKVHAEIQIAYHYEVNPISPAPRVICSSKDACFLCDLFVRLHGKFYIPGTHGRLYQGWRLPQLDRLALSSIDLGKQIMVAQELNRATERKIRELLDNRGRPRYPPPTESVFLSSPVWTPSQVSVVSSGRTVTPRDPVRDSLSSIPEWSDQTDRQQRREESEGQNETIRLENVPEIMPNISNHYHDREYDNEMRRVEEEATSAVSSDTNDHICSTPKYEQKYLIQGQKIRRQLGVSQMDLYFTANSLHLFISSSGVWGRAQDIRAASQVGEERTSSELCSLEIEWLSEDDRELVVEGNEVQVFDVDAMESGAEVTTSNGSTTGAKCVYMAQGTDIISLKYITP
jgi:hypothetical protein